MDILLNVLVCFGLSAVGACFFVAMPAVANLLAALWSAVMAEQVIARLRGVPSGTSVEDEADDGPASALGRGMAVK
jgi:uncharacterized protein involved in cysteine biosynthesis